jgi:lysozyme
MNPILKSRLIKASTGGAVAIALALGAWYEGDGPTVRQANGQVLHRVYIDPAGIPTVCRGITGPDVIKDKLYTRAECDVLERKHLAIAEAAASKILIHWSEYDDWTKAALIDFAYNAGSEALRTSTMARLFNGGQHDAGCTQLRLWVKARVKGQLVALNGLVDRRGTEMDICLHGAPS